MATTPKNKTSRGPVPERLKIKGDWEAAVGKALKKERPKEGWPEAEKISDPTKPQNP
jgi:hypothetical protein